jgi:phosphoserine phosphatase
MDLTRVVDRLSILAEPVDFRELCRRAVPREARYVVFDLDRTMHLGHNMGELLGWEICAHSSYGPAYLDELEAERVGGRIYLERKKPWGLLRYVRLALTHWGPPGLFYLLWGKIASRSRGLRRRAFMRFGREPVRAVQQIPQHALMHRIASLPLDTVRELAARVWTRYRRDQTIEREDIEWLRTHCPQARIVISSASPQPTLEACAKALGIEDIVYSALEEHDGRLSAPCDLRRLARPEAELKRITPPSMGRINAGHAKLDELYARYPDIRDVVAVGISDTGYGEDHCWSEGFTHLIDVNSTTPFPPIVAADARVRSIVSARLLTRAEKDARANGQAGLDPRRLKLAETGDRELDAVELEARLSEVHAGIERLARELAEEDERLAVKRAAPAGEAEQLEAQVEATVAAFNRAEDRRQRARVRRELAAQLRRRHAVRRRLVKLERPVAELSFALAEALERARSLLDGPRPA